MLLILIVFELSELFACCAGPLGRYIVGAVGEDEWVEVEMKMDHGGRMSKQAR